MGRDHTSLPSIPVFLLVQSIPSPRSAAVYWGFGLVLVVGFWLVVVFFFFFLLFIFLLFLFSTGFSSWSDVEFRFVLSFISVLLSVKPCVFSWLKELVQRGIHTSKS